MSNLSDEAVTQLQADYDRLLARHDALLVAGDRLGDAAGAMLSYRAVTGSPPVHTSSMWSRLEHGFRAWSSAR